jgi:hypothetical protein
MPDGVSIHRQLSPLQESKSIFGTAVIAVSPSLAWHWKAEEARQ